MQDIIAPLKYGDQNKAVANLNKALLHSWEKDNSLLGHWQEQMIGRIQEELSRNSNSDLFGEGTKEIIFRFQHKENLQATG